MSTDEQASETSPYDRDDHYLLSAQYYELVAASEGSQARPDVDFFVQFAEAGRRVLDIGSGTGRVALRVAELGAEVWCVEPSPVMRAIMLSFLAKRTELQPWITVVPGSAQDITAPGEYDYAYLAGSLSFLAPPDRLKTFARLARLLKPGGILALDMVGLHLGQSRPRRCVCKFNVGRCEYRLWDEKELASSRTCIQTFTYETYLDGYVLETFVVRELRHVNTRQEVAAQLADVGILEFDPQPQTNSPKPQLDTLVAKKA